MMEMMDPGVEIALIVACGTITSGLFSFLSLFVSGRITAAQRREEREADRKDRQDVADKVDRAAARANEVARVAAEVAADAAHSADGLQRGIGQIHTLVNDNLTTAKQGELNHARIALKALERLPQSQANDRDALAMASLRDRIAVLGVNLADRGIQQRQLDSEIAKDAKDAKDAKNPWIR